MKLKDIIKTQKDIEEIGYKIENNFIEDVNINTIAHFGNVTWYYVNKKYKLNLEIFRRKTLSNKNIHYTFS